MYTDTQLVEALNQFARSAPSIDVLIVFITHSYLFKGGVMMTFLWWGWFRPDPEQERHRQLLMSVLLAALAAMTAARVLAWALPHRLRPMHDVAVDMVLPIGMPPAALTGWSSFPSDHAALFGCLACGMFLVSTRAGLLATGYCVVVIMLPRVYTGFHYPSDLLAGFLLGALSTWLVSREVVLQRIIQPAYAWFVQRPGLWYPLFFLLSYQIVTLFDDVRNLGALCYMIVERVL
ncbi:MAG: phosphatase PAP2 family protein [Pseudomonadales bacterium]|nr:phosphatase PAP2 family protein [Halieaceae bacterium]MCP5189642.1 phosphatase PAP2 family protein [Pseudomonadales bacterium]MCP5203874.1 phosphatase PAP2 family protein [Pseudomonadales bacterium]